MISKRKNSRIIIFLVIVLLLSAIIYFLYRPRPIILDVEHSTVLRVQVNFNDALTDCGDYDEERIKYLLSNSYERRTFEKARSFSLDDVKISVVLNTGTDLKQILLGETNYTFKGYGTIKYKIVNAQELEIKLLETLVTAGGGS